MRTLTAHERQRYAIGKARERRAAELAPLVAEVERLVSEVGWRRARPVVEAAMAPVRVTGPRGHRVGKRTGARLVAALAALPVQQRFPFVASQPSGNVLREARDRAHQER